MPLFIVKGLSIIDCGGAAIPCIWQNSQQGRMPASLRFPHFTNNDQHKELRNRPSLRDERTSRAADITEKWPAIFEVTNSAGFQTDIKRHSTIMKKYCWRGSETNIALRVRVKLERKETASEGISQNGCEMRVSIKTILYPVENGVWLIFV